MKNFGAVSDNKDIATKDYVDSVAGGGVTSFNSRTGVVTPQSGDYTAAMVGTIPATPVTKAEYEALIQAGTVDPNTAYLVTDDQGSQGIPYTSAQTDALLAQKNPIVGKGINLLDNWYFPNPVNQRGLTTYSGSEYTIDRWKINNSGSLAIENGYISFTPTAAYGRLIQYAENGTEYNGKTITLSIMYKTTANGYRAGFEYKDGGYGVPSGSVDFPASADWNVKSVTVTTDLFEKLIVTICSDNGTVISTPIYIKACKFELGTEQTLAHNEGTDANPNWVLNDPPPEYGTELFKCQTSTADATDTYANKPLYPDGYAPGGFGLGTTSPKILTDADNLNDVTAYGWYGWGATIPANAPTLLGNNAKYCVMLVSGSVQCVYSGNHQTMAIRLNAGDRVWEYINPQMTGNEYRTIERWGGKPVYINSVAVGVVAANSTGEKALSITNLGNVIDIRGNYYQSPPLTFYSAPNAVLTLAYDATNAKIKATNNTASQMSGVTVVLKYTKSTD